MTPSSKVESSLLKTVCFRLLILANFILSAWFISLLVGEAMKSNYTATAKETVPPEKAIITLAQIK
jgi:hypothetical protein